MKNPFTFRDDRQDVLQTHIFCVPLVHLIFEFTGLEGVVQERIALSPHMLDFAVDKEGFCFLERVVDETWTQGARLIAGETEISLLDVNNMSALELAKNEIILVTCPSPPWRRAQLHVFDRKSLQRKHINTLCYGKRYSMLPSGIHITSMHIVLVFSSCLFVLDRQYNVRQITPHSVDANWYTYSEGFYVERGTKCLHRLIRRAKEYSFVPSRFQIRYHERELTIGKLCRYMTHFTYSITVTMVPTTESWL